LVEQSTLCNIRYLVAGSMFALEQHDPLGHKKAIPESPRAPILIAGIPNIPPEQP